MQATSGLDRKYLDLKSIQRLTRFAFVPRRMLDGRYTGKHSSPQKGQSVEFRDFRQYIPGDDVGQIDWKVYGRTDKLYLRVFEHETELTVNLLIDASSSMAYGSPVQGSKYDHACRLAAALGFIIAHGQDRVGFGLAHAGLTGYKRPTAAVPQFVEALEMLEQIRPRGNADLAGSMSELATQLRRGEVVIVFSDLWEDLDDFFEAATQILHRGGELIVFHVLHGDELRLPEWQETILVDSESGQRLSLNVADVRGDYARRLQAHLAGIESQCKRYDVPYQMAAMNEPYQQTLERYLARRSSL